MSHILVAYATMAGSTAEVAKVVGEEIAKAGHQVDVLPISEVKDINGYTGVVIGGPMIMGWHRSAMRFLRMYLNALQKIPTAIFVMSMSLTKTVDMSVDGVKLTVDENLPQPPANADVLSFKERYAQLKNYLRPILSAVQPAKPVSIGVFGGRMEYGRLKWWAVLFVMLIIQARAGDRRNWDVIKAWAAEVGRTFR
jgi:menaquinone-dependent protoporphyrinogen oxidase